MKFNIPERGIRGTWLFFYIFSLYLLLLLLDEVPNVGTIKNIKIVKNKTFEQNSTNCIQRNKLNPELIIVYAWMLLRGKYYITIIRNTTV